MEYAFGKNYVFYEFYSDRYMEGESLPFDIDNNDCSVHADVLFRKTNNIFICGRVTTFGGKPLPGVLVILQIITSNKGKTESVRVVSTGTDLDGFYQFNLADQNDALFLVTVGAAARQNGRFTYKTAECIAVQDEPFEVTRFNGKSYIRLVMLKGDFKMDEDCCMDCKKDECDYIKGNLSEFEVKENDCEIRVDLIVKEVHHVRVWGQVTTCEGKPVEDALVKLVKVMCKEGKCFLNGIAHTITDCQGFYQFDICEKKEKAQYLVIVGKAAKGKERFVFDQICQD